MKCICYNIEIKDIVKRAKELGLFSCQEVCNVLHICDKCRLCNEYIQRGLNKEQNEEN